MVLPAVAAPHRGGDAALGPGAGAGHARPGARQHDGRHGRQLQCGEQPGDARAQDQRAIGLDDVVDVANVIASMRSTARRARTAMAGSTITSVVMVWSEWRIFSRVMRFMCGHRLQGRTKSTCGYSTATLSL